MKSSILKLDLRKKIIAIAACSAILPVTFLFVTVLLLKGSAHESLSGEIEGRVEHEMKAVTHDVYSLILTGSDAVQQKVSSDLNVARHVMNGLGAVRSSSETVSWRIINQYTKASSTVDLPKMLVGDTWLGQNPEPDRPTPLVDEVKGLVGGTCTVFQRINEAGDMLRVATNVMKTDGKRAIGTYIPAVNPDGGPNPVVAKVLAGQTFRGRAFVVNDWYITAYEPILDTGGRVAGVLYVGVKQLNVDSLRKGITSVEVGNSGSVTIVGGSGKQQGRTIMAGRGQDLTTEVDGDGNRYLDGIIGRAKQLVAGKVGFQRVATGEVGGRLLAYTYFAPWDWVILASTKGSDFQASSDRVTAVLDSFLWVPLGVGIVLVLLSSAASFFVGGRIVQPLRKTVEAMQAMSQGEGDLTTSLEVSSNDEIGELTRAFNRFLETIRAMVGEVAGMTGELTLSAETLTRSSETLVGSSESMRNGSDQVNGTVERMESEINTAAAAAEQASVNVKEVAATSSRMSGDVASIAEQSAQMAESVDAVATAIEEMTTSLEEVARICGNASEAGQSSNTQAAQASNQMEELAEAASKIGHIVKLIQGIADQTNLLALNATIEAASAGEAGKGFAVVANEVKELARQTATATEEITKEVDMIQDSTRQTGHLINSVSTGIVELSSLTDQIASAVEEQSITIREISKSMTEGAGASREISDRVGTVAGDIDGVAGSTQEVATGIVDIARVINEMSSAFGQVAGSIQNVNDSVNTSVAEVGSLQSAVTVLSEGSDRLKAVVGQFRM